MSPDTPLFGRLTLGNNRISLGRAGFATLFLRATGELHKLRVSDDAVIQLELCRNKLPDSTTFDKSAILEHSIAAKILTNPEDDSPFEGISVGRVAEVMASKEYAAYEAICQPMNRVGLNQVEIAEIRIAYFCFAADCALHFPKWVE